MKISIVFVLAILLYSVGSVHAASDDLGKFQKRVARVAPIDGKAGKVLCACTYDGTSFADRVGFVQQYLNDSPIGTVVNVQCSGDGFNDDGEVSGSFSCSQFFVLK